MHAPDTADVENAWNEPMSTDLAANEVRFPKREADIIRELIEKKHCIVRVWAPLELKMITHVEDPAELKKKLKANLNTVAIIGALFGGANLASYMSATGVDEDNHNDMSAIVGGIRFMAAGCGLATAVYSAIIMSMVNAIPKVHCSPSFFHQLSLGRAAQFCLFSSTHLIAIMKILFIDDASFFL